jgi:hypothetical protein
MRSRSRNAARADDKTFDRARCARYHCRLMTRTRWRSAILRFGYFATGVMKVAVERSRCASRSRSSVSGPSSVVSFYSSGSCSVRPCVRRHRAVKGDGGRTNPPLVTLIAIEDLNIKGLAGGMRAKYVADALVGTIDRDARIQGCKCRCRDHPCRSAMDVPDVPGVRDHRIIKAKTLAKRLHSCECATVVDRALMP